MITKKKPCSYFYVYRTVAIYKQPPLSSVNNIFTLPFVPNVWIVMFIIMLVFAVTLIFLIWMSNWLHGVKMKLSIALDTVTLVFAAICQQGTYKNKSHVSFFDYTMLYWIYFSGTPINYKSLIRCIIINNITINLI